MRSTTPPTFAAILRPRTAMACSGRLREEAKLAQLNTKLSALPVTAADKAARCARYDNERPRFTLPAGKPQAAAVREDQRLPRRPLCRGCQDHVPRSCPSNDWALVITDKAGVMNPADLAKFDAVVWNNVSGDVLTVTQRRAFENYIRSGGGFVAVHGTAGDPSTSGTGIRTS